MRLLVPNKDKRNLVTKDNINKWAESGWVDLRKKQVKYWQGWLKKVYQEAKSLKDNCLSVPLSRNWQCLDDSDIGEILGYIYNLQGGERKTEF